MICLLFYGRGVCIICYIQWVIHICCYCQADAFSFNAVVVAGGGAGSGSGGTTACIIDVNGERISLSADTAVSFEGDLVNILLFIICQN